jgi:hypothetical protein
VDLGALHRVHSAFSMADFLKRNWKMIFRIYVNALENHNLHILALKIVKQILVDFLGVDLWFKILHVEIATLFCRVLFNH